MKNREAIEYLNDVRNGIHIPAPGIELPLLNDKEKEAIDLAISALEKQVQTKEAIPHRNYQYLSDYWCECGWHLGKKGDVKFCANCGRIIKWD